MMQTPKTTIDVFRDIALTIRNALSLAISEHGEMEYCTEWIENRPEVAPAYVSHYLGLLDARHNMGACLDHHAIQVCHALEAFAEGSMSLADFQKDLPGTQFTVEQEPPEDAIQAVAIHALVNQWSAFDRQGEIRAALEACALKSRRAIAEGESHVHDAGSDGMGL